MVNDLFTFSIDWGRALFDSAIWIARAWAIAAMCTLVVLVLIGRYTTWGRQFWRITGAYYTGAQSVRVWLWLGVLLAGLAAAWKPIDGMLAPLIAALAVIPIVAITPILNTMFGASSQFGRQMVAMIAAFIPVFINVLRGLRQTRPVHRDLLRASAASGLQTFRMLTLPTALPYLMTGLRIASSLAVIAALVAEYFGGPSDGIGTSIATYVKSGRAALAWAYVGGGLLIGLVFYLVTSLLERIVSRRSPG